MVQQLHTKCRTMRTSNYLKAFNRVDKRNPCVVRIALTLHHFEEACTELRQRLATASAFLLVAVVGLADVLNLRILIAYIS